MHRRRSGWTDDAGSAALEFIGVGVILLVPLVYLMIALGVVQEQTLGAEAAARHTARALGQAPDAEAAAVRSDAIISEVVEEYGMERANVQVGISCTPASAVCPAAGTTVVVTVSTLVRLPFVPPILGLDELAVIPVEAQAAQKLSRLWGTG